MFGHGMTYTSHPVGCAVALANLDLLEGGVLAHAREVAPYFQARLKTLEELPLVGEVRGAGLMACVECVADRESKDPLLIDKDVGKRIDAHCHELGLLVRPLINMCVMCPPLVITREQIDDMVGDLARGHFADDGGFAEGGGLAGVRRGHFSKPLPPRAIYSIRSNPRFLSPSPSIVSIAENRRSRSISQGL